MNKFLIVSLHDLHPASLQDFKEQISFFAELGIQRFSILAVPFFHHGAALEGETAVWLSERQDKGDDIVLHGHYHDRQDREGGSWFYTKFYTANEAEFLDLPDDHFNQRLEHGMEIWSKNGWSVNGFIAPAWLMPETQNELLKQKGFVYTTRLKSIDLLQKGRRETTQSLCYSTRALWRRVASLEWNRYLFRKLLGRSVMRLSLHPMDLHYPAIRKQIADHVRLALANGYQPLSYAEYAAL